MKQHIAIDGPAGAGKSTVARGVAKKLGYLYLDTGALYRALTLHFLRKGLDPGIPNLENVLSEVNISLESSGDGTKVVLNGEDVTVLIRSPEVDRMVSRVAESKGVRDFLRGIQRTLALSKPSVVEGRDIGTVILPEADLKIFLTAKPEVRAYRRWLELRARGNTVDYKRVLKNILERDMIDSSRQHAPLKKADDAVLIDTSFLTIEEVIHKIYTLAVGEGNGRCGD
ncbi:MAG: (d)CMP kinase [Candidatus Atribacteria bacterium]|nr:(d)CMP kinase [Candidatus Atribacteria bacterium]